MIAFLLGSLIALIVVGGALVAANHLWPLPNLDDDEALGIPRRETERREDV